MIGEQPRYYLRQREYADAYSRYNGKEKAAIRFFPERNQLACKQELESSSVYSFY